MYVCGTTIRTEDLTRGQRPIEKFLAQWQRIKSERGARYNHTLSITWRSEAGRREILVTCLAEIRKDTFLLESRPLGPDFEARHYILLTRKNGRWVFDTVIAAADRNGRGPSARGRIMRACF